jgi:hypothetical protein
MLVFVIKDQSNRAAADLRRKLVGRLAHGGSTNSGVGASGKPGAVHTSSSPLLASGRAATAANIRATVCRDYTALAPNRFKDFWRD